MQYVKQDLFEYLKTIPSHYEVFIPHVVNNLGGWGSGFVVPLGQKFPRAKEEYLKWYQDNKRFFLGNIRISYHEGDEPYNNVVHMLAQNGYKCTDNPVPLIYDALQGCIQRLEDILLNRYEDGWSTKVVCPKFGSGLAGGDWQIIEGFIKEYWDHCTEVVVCEI